MASPRTAHTFRPALDVCEPRCLLSHVPAPAAVHALASGVQALAAQIAGNPNITLALSHASGHQDLATPFQNIFDTVNGRPARRSSYTDGKHTGPGGTVALNPLMLQGLLTLAARFKFNVAEIAGGVHGRNSPHYKGSAVDINTINGQPVNKQNPNLVAFEAMAEKLPGFVTWIAPNGVPGKPYLHEPGHMNHIHIAFAPGSWVPRR